MFLRDLLASDGASEDILWHSMTRRELSLCFLAAKCIYGGKVLAEGQRILTKSCRECRVSLSVVPVTSTEQTKDRRVVLLWGACWLRWVPQGQNRWAGVKEREDLAPVSVKQACVQWLTQREKQPVQEGCERENEIGATMNGKVDGDPGERLRGGRRQVNVRYQL